MKRLFIYTTTLLAIVLSPTLIFAEEETVPPTLIISEVQTGSEESASEEFIEIANLSPVVQTLGGVKLQYRSASGSSWTTKYEFIGQSIIPYGRITMDNYLETSSGEQFSGGLAGSGGHIRLLFNETTIDTLGWGSAIEPEVISAIAPNPGQSLKRRFNEDGWFIDTNNNSEDFLVSETPSPFSNTPIEEDDYQPEEEEVNQVEDTVETPKETPISEVIEEIIPEAKPTNFKLDITELMPDPVSPFTDSEHELIEIFNPNKFVVNLEGYRIESGGGRYGKTLSKYELKPNEFFTLYSSETNVTLSNSGSTVQLMTPAGNIVSEVVYEQAEPGYSWSKISGKWFWVKPSPNKPNPKQQPATAESGDSGDSAKSGEVLSKKTIDYGSEAASESESKTSAFSTNEEDDEDKSNNALLAVVGVFTVTYLIYEYRNEIRAYITQFGRYASNRRKSRSKA